MKKLLSFLVMIGVLVGVMGVVMGANQETYFTPTGVVAFSVSPTLNFPSAIPGAQTSDTSTLTLGDTNTEDLIVEIYLTDVSDEIFTNVALSTVDASITGLEAEPNLRLDSVGHITIGVDDIDPEGTQTVQDKDILATLTVPPGALPTQKTGTITYEVTAPAPVEEE
jgi:hypothetical protein